MTEDHSLTQISPQNLEFWIHLSCIKQLLFFHHKVSLHDKHYKKAAIAGKCHNVLHMSMKTIGYLHSLQSEWVQAVVLLIFM